MKTLKYFVLMLLAVSICVEESLACTNLIVGRKASKDGSVICTYNCDGFGFAGCLSYSPAGRHTQGEKIAIDGWGPRKEGQFVDRVDYTYGVIGMMNEKQVSIVETTFDGRLELVNEEGLLDYYTLMQLALQRSTTAREAIQWMTDLVEDYGYSSSGETITICDKEEAWIMEIIGKGSGRKGAVWVALRVPDDCICAHANLSRIRQFPLHDNDNCLYAKDVISFAREKGYYTGKDSDFSFRDAYCPIDFENVRYADARVYSFFRHHVADKAEMDQYLPYLNGDFAQCDHLPLWIKPDTLVDVKGIMADMRDHFEDTPLDMTTDVSAGPWGMPIRPLPMTYKDSEGNPMFRERPIATQQSCMTMVCQMRSWLPDEVGGVLWFNCDDAGMVAYVPVFCATNVVPDPFRRENNPHREFSKKSAFWMNNFVANMIYPRYSLMIGDLHDAQNELEGYYVADLDSVAKTIFPMTRGERITYLTRKSAVYAERMMTRWDSLARMLIVKYNDLVVYPTEDGTYTEGGYQTPGYNPSFIDAISRGTGSRYKLDQLIERRER